MPHIGRFHFEAVEHTADKAIVAYGPSFAAMLESAAAGLFAQQFDLAGIPRRRSWEIRAAADSDEDLLVAWLRELVYLAEKDELALCDFEILQIEGHSLRARVWGSPLTPAITATGAPVKAVTYHNLHISRQSGRWQARVTFDV